MVKKRSTTIKKEGVHEADNDLKVLIGQRIRRIRTRCGYSGKRAARESGINRSVLSQIEHGKVHINAVALCRLAYALKCNIAEFFPALPDTQSLADSDVAVVAQENKHAAEFLRKAFKIKS